MRANDDPHGVFALEAGGQAVRVEVEGSEVSRTLVLNVTRQAGAFGNASVAYRVGGGGPEAQGLLGEAAVGRVLVREGETYTAVSLPISSQVRCHQE